MGRALLADGRLTKMLDMVLGEVASYTPAIPLRGRELKFRFRDRVEELSAIARFRLPGIL
jgi:hypothetical protein